MTQQQQSELEKAIERAHRVGVTILARGIRKADGARVFGVTSQRDVNHLHVVTLEGGRLVCDCAARVICCHRGLVHEILAAEYAAAAKDAPHSACGHELVSTAAPVRSAPARITLSREHSGPAPRPAFSMWK